MRIRDWAWLLAPLVVLGAMIGFVIWPSIARTGEDNIRPDFLRDNGAPVATSGESPNHSIGLVDSPLGELLSGRGPATLRPLIGQRVQVPVDMGVAANDVAFWVGRPGRDLLVVINRDTRSSAERQQGFPSDSALGTVSDPTQLIVSGVIDPVPYAEATYGWALTREDAALLNRRGAYLRVHSIGSANR